MAILLASSSYGVRLASYWRCDGGMITDHIPRRWAAIIWRRTTATAATTTEYYDNE